MRKKNYHYNFRLHKQINKIYTSLNSSGIVFYLLSFQPVKVDSEEDDNLRFPNVSEISDASLLLLKRKSNGKYTLFRVRMKSFLRRCFFENVIKE